MTPEEFSRKIRERYPGAYDSVGDEDLARRVIEKYPVYQDQVVFGEAPTVEPVVETKESFVQKVAREEIEKVAEPASRIFEPDTPFAERALRLATLPLRSVGTAGRIVGRIVAEPFTKGIERTAQFLGGIPTVQRIAETETAGNILEGASKIAEKIQGGLETIRKRVDPEVFRSIEDAAEIALWALGAKPAERVARTSFKVAGEVTKEAVEVGTKIAKEKVKEATKAVKIISKTAVVTGKTATKDALTATRIASAKTGLTTLINKARNLGTPLEESFVNVLKRKIDDTAPPIDEDILDLKQLFHAENIPIGLRLKKVGEVPKKKKIPELSSVEKKKIIDELVDENLIDVDTIKSSIPQKTVPKLDFYLDKAKTATKFIREKTPLEFAGEAAGKALIKLKTIQNRIGKAKGETIKAQSTQKVDFVDDVITQYNEVLTERLGLRFNKKGDLVNAPDRVAVVTSSSDLKLIKDILNDLKQAKKTPTIQVIDDIVDRIQGRVFDKKQSLTVPLNTRVEGVTKGIARNLNESLKDAVGGEFRDLNSQFAKVRELTEELNRKLGKKGERGGSLMKRVFSPSDNRTKEMFREILELTGDDLIEDATFAKFAMQTFGDSRQLSLLEEAGLISGSLKVRLIGEFSKRIGRPAGKAKEIARKAEKEREK